MSKSIIIIGAGITGLAAGCYGRMNGFKTTIFELHSLPGGLCTAWKRKGFTFDGCIHWLVGSNPKSSMNIYWRELGALRERQIYNSPEYVRVEGAEKTFIVYTNLEQLEQHMLKLAPADAVAIHDFCETTRKFARFANALPAPGSLPALAQIGTLLLEGLPMLARLRTYARLSIQEYAKRFSDPFLRQAFISLFDMPDFPMTGVFMTLAWMHNQDAGYPIGGSLAFAQSVEKRYLELGGELHYNSRVEKILVEDGRAVGVRLSDGSEQRADYVVSAADGHATIFNMLDGKYVTDEIRNNYATLPIFPPVIQVSLGVDMDTSHLPGSVSFTLPEPIVIAGKERRSLGFRNFFFDPSMAPPGKTAITLIIDSNYDYWKAMAEDSERYEAEKKQVAITVIEAMSQRIPGLAEHIEVVDVATPLTYERYTNNWKGSMEGWLLTTKTMKFLTGGQGMSKTLPGLENFYMAGQWVEPGGGIPTAAMSARRSIETICKREKRRFLAQPD